ncbi:MAG TPA: hypothetical protein PK135_13895, partial [Arenimonas sp.]|nr:hypothetical protein [Arenimonas sp.]
LYELLVVTARSISYQGSLLQHSVRRAALQLGKFVTCTEEAFIDGIRDDCGNPEYELRHTDIRSGQPWPLLAPTA